MHIFFMWISVEPVEVQGKCKTVVKFFFNFFFINNNKLIQVVGIFFQKCLLFNVGQSDAA
jgi:hypothetical protein